MPHIDCFLATISPYTYLAGLRLEEIAERHGATVTYRPVDLAQLFARTGGTLPKERHVSRQEYRRQDLLRQAAKHGMRFNIQPAHWPTNPAPSSYALIAAQRAGGGDLGRLVHAFCKACWAEERDIAEDDVIRDCLESVGFDGSLADTGLLAGAEEFSANLEEAVNRGVFGAPFYITDTDERFWGQDRLDDLDACLSART